MKQVLALTTMLCIFFLSAWLSAAELEPGAIEQQHLFKIERSKNANIVQYDARVLPDGKLDPDKPVVGYWIRLAEDGRKMKLRFLEKRFAYGFRAAYDSASTPMARLPGFVPGLLVLLGPLLPLPFTRRQFPDLP
ncbi:MAG: DUF4833 domain-containing protein [Lysobacterales bacterium]